MKKVLVPIDLSSVSEEALQFAVDCACSDTRYLVLLHVVDYMDIASLGLVGLANREQELREEMIKEAQQHLDELTKKYARKGLKFKTRIVFDRPWRGIINIAIEEQVDAIIMGSHGRGRVAESLLGSVAGRVVHEAPVPVTIIRPKAMRDRLIKHWHHIGKE